MKHFLFTLLRLGLGTSKLEKEDISALLAASPEQWEEIRDTANYQGVSGVVLDGVKAILDTHGSNCFNHFEDKSFWRRFIVKWACSVEQNYESANERQLNVIKSIQKHWADEGIRMMLMKGMAMGTYYPIPNHRSVGDIDCYLFDDYDRGNQLAKSWADQVDVHWYKHSQIHYRGQIIENHQFFVHTREGKKSKNLNQLLVNELKKQEFERFPGSEVLLPPPMFNAIFLTYHALTHFLEEGIKLKQLLDWALFLKRDADHINWLDFYNYCDVFHLRRFAVIATDIAVHQLGVVLCNPLIETKSPYTDRVIKSVLFDKDYVFSSGKSGWANRFHLVKNLFKYSWKYHHIYQRSIIQQLYYFSTGYLFKTE